jgi:hypothetical protein
MEKNHPKKIAVLLPLDNFIRNNSVARVQMWQANVPADIKERL